MLNVSQLLTSVIKTFIGLKRSNNNFRSKNTSWNFAIKSYLETWSFEVKGHLHFTRGKKSSDTALSHFYSNGKKLKKDIFCIL